MPHPKIIATTGNFFSKAAPRRTKPATTIKAKESQCQPKFELIARERTEWDRNIDTPKSELCQEHTVVGLDQSIGNLSEAIGQIHQIRESGRCREITHTVVDETTSDFSEDNSDDRNGV